MMKLKDETNILYFIKCPLHSCITEKQGPTDGRAYGKSEF